MDSLGRIREESGGPVLPDAIRHHWAAIAALVAIAVAAAIVYSVNAGKRYDAEAVLLVSPLSDASDVFASVSVFRDSGSGASASVYALGRTLTTPRVLDAVRRRLGEREMSRSELLGDVSVKPVQQSATVSIIASTDSPERSALIANTFVDVVRRQRAARIQQELRLAIARLRARLPGARRDEATAIEERLAELGALAGAGDPTVRVLARAVPPDSASSPSPLISVVIAVLASLLVGAAGAFLLELFLPRIQSDDDALRRVPILAYVPRARRDVVRRYMSGGAALPGDLWEAYRILRASLSGRSARSVLVTSAIQGEGKTMTSVNLAIALAASGRRVVLVDGDLRRPMVAKVFGITDPPDAFADLLFERAEPADVLIDAPGYGSTLRLVLAGADRPLDLLEPSRIRSMLDRLQREADVVVVDSPALTEFADAIALAEAADVVLVAVRLGRSRRDKLAELEQRLAQHDVAFAGFVVTGRSRSRGDAPAHSPERRSEPRVVADAGSVAVGPQP